MSLTPALQQSSVVDVLIDIRTAVQSTKLQLLAVFVLVLAFYKWPDYQLTFVLPEWFYNNLHNLTFIRKVGHPLIFFVNSEIFQQSLSTKGECMLLSFTSRLSHNEILSVSPTFLPWEWGGQSSFFINTVLKYASPLLRQKNSYIQTMWVISSHTIETWAFVIILFFVFTFGDTFSTLLKKVHVKLGVWFCERVLHVEFL